MASDLNWRRLKYWRRLLAQALDPASAPGAAESVSEVRGRARPARGRPGLGAGQLAGARLGWRVQAGKVQPRRGDRLASSRTPNGPRFVRVRRLAEGPPEVRRVRIACTLDGKPGAMDLIVGGRAAAGWRSSWKASEPPPRTMTVPPQSAAELIGRQLSDRERDPVFRESMAVAQVMAQSLL